MFLFKFAWKFVAFLLLVALVIPSWALAKTWYTANNEKKLRESMKTILLPRSTP